MPNIYQKNFLSNVIFRLDFPPILELETDKPKKFQSLITEKFPILEPINQMGFVFKNDGKESTTENVNKTVWRFKSADSNIFVELDTNYLAVSIKQYTNFNDLKVVIEFVITSLFTTYPNIVVNRTGLRYINQIHFDEPDYFDWSNYINKNLVESLNFIEDKNLLRRYFNSYDISPEEGVQISFKYGIFNKTFPEAITGKEFILDYDCFTQSTLSQEELVPKIKILNDYATNYFEKSITDSLRTKLKNE